MKNGAFVGLICRHCQRSNVQVQWVCLLVQYRIELSAVQVPCVFMVVKQYTSSNWQRVINNEE